MTRINQKPQRHRFILNPDPADRHAVCPLCEGQTDERKFPLLIHVEPRNPVAINKTCRYCPRCDLIIAQKGEVEEQLSFLFANWNPATIGPEYLVMGTLDHEVWDRGRQTLLSIPEMLDNLYLFKDVLEVEPADQDLPPARGRRRQAGAVGGRPRSGRRKGRRG